MPIEFSRRYFLIRSTAVLAAACLGHDVALSRALRSLQATGLATPHSDSSDEEMIIYSREFLTMESSMAALTTWITPTKSFFDGNRQPLEPLWNPGGYLWNGIDRINVNVQA